MSVGWGWVSVGLCWGGLGRGSRVWSLARREKPSLAEPLATAGDSRATVAPVWRRLGYRPSQGHGAPPQSRGSDRPMKRAKVWLDWSIRATRRSRFIGRAGLNLKSKPVHNLRNVLVAQGAIIFKPQEPDPWIKHRTLHFGNGLYGPDNTSIDSCRGCESIVQSIVPNILSRPSQINPRGLRAAL